MRELVRDEIWPLEAIWHDLGIDGLLEALAPLQERVKARGLWDRVRGAREAGAAAVVATHFLDETVEADRVLTLEDGRLL